MGQARGRITQEEAEQYGIPMIMLLDNSNGSTGSGGGVATGTGSYSWTVRWTPDGFTGVSWNVGTWGTAFNWGNATDAEIEEFLTKNGGSIGANISYAMTAEAQMVMAGCGGLEPN